MGSSSMEFEIKVALKSAEDVDDLLGSLQFHTRESVDDLYFDTPDRQLFRRGIFVRVRNSRVFEIKHNDSADLEHLVCAEHVYAWPLSDSDHAAVAGFLSKRLGTSKTLALRDPLLAFGLHEFVRISKDRTVYLKDGLEVSLDRVRGLGVFLEIEAKHSTAVNEVTRLCVERGFENLPLGYVELWLRQNEFGTYEAGRYLLEADRKSRT